MGLFISVKTPRVVVTASDTQTKGKQQPLPEDATITLMLTGAFSKGTEEDGREREKKSTSRIFLLLVKRTSARHTGESPRHTCL